MIGLRRTRVPRASAAPGARPRTAHVWPRGGCRAEGPCADQGYSTVETVIIVPLLVLFTLAVVQFALVCLAHIVAEGAARSGVQAGRAYTATDADGRARTYAYLQAADPGLLPGARVEVTRTSTTITVHVHAHVLAVPLIPYTFSIDEHSSGPLERFVPAAPQ